MEYQWGARAREVIAARRARAQEATTEAAIPLEQAQSVRRRLVRAHAVSPSGVGGARFVGGSASGAATGSDAAALSVGRFVADPSVGHMLQPSAGSRRFLRQGGQAEERNTFKSGRRVSRQNGVTVSGSRTDDELSLDRRQKTLYWVERQVYGETFLSRDPPQSPFLSPEHMMSGENSPRFSIPASPPGSEGEPPPAPEGSPPAQRRGKRSLLKRVGKLVTPLRGHRKQPRNVPESVALHSPPPEGGADGAATSCMPELPASPGSDAASEMASRVEELEARFSEALEKARRAEEQSKAAEARAAAAEEASAARARPRVPARVSARALGVCPPRRRAPPSRPPPRPPPPRSPL